MKIAIIGGGAAGFFAAISAKENHPQAAVVIFEKSQKLLSKVKVSGGGRCNVTNGCTSISELSKAYPRGGKQLKKAFNTFNTKHTFDWFKKRGVTLMVQADGRAFPTTQRSQTIVDCFLDEAKRCKVEIEIGVGINSISEVGNQLELCFQNKERPPQKFDRVIVATGGSRSRKDLAWAEAFGHAIVEPVPSLFTFNMPTESVANLMGVVVKNVLVKIEGTKIRSEGALLITHWGMSGPAILKLSAFGARILNEMKYDFRVQINWINEPNTEIVINTLQSATEQYSKKILANHKPYALPERLWLFLLKRSNLSADKKWGELGKKALNKLTSVLTNDIFEAKGKTTFKEEFVTCGGISLNSVDMATMQSRTCKNLYFAGEILYIDGITGGYNFQAAWTTAFIAAKLG